MYKLQHVYKLKLTYPGHLNETSQVSSNASLYYSCVCLMNFDLRYFLLPLNSPSPQCREVIKETGVLGYWVHSCAMTTLQVPLLVNPLSKMQRKTIKWFSFVFCLKDQVKEGLLVVYCRTQLDLASL